MGVRHFIFMLFLPFVLFSPKSLGGKHANPRDFPVIVVHGLHQTSGTLKGLCTKLEAAGFKTVVPTDMYAHHGTVPVKVLAEHLERKVQEVMRETKAKKVNLVGFSMGALVSRYVIQRLSGKHYVHAYVSLAGPHNGSYLAYVPFLQEGVRDMRPGSALLNDLNDDQDPWGPVRVHAFYTPYDFIVFPARSAILKKARVWRFDAALHTSMLRDPDVQDAVAKALLASDMNPRVPGFAERPCTRSKIDSRLGV
jgi:pimeloyl-ACP methyl ester carboxylesterase